MAANYVLLEKITVGAAGASSVTFNSIPQTGYTDLVVKFSARSDRAGNTDSPMRLYPNGSSTGITLKFLQGNGSSASSGTEAAFAAYMGETPAATATASTFGNGEIYIPNYTSSNYKSISTDVVTENNATAVKTQMFAYLWSNTAAITSLQILDGLGNFVANSTFYLYGVAKLGTTPAIVPYATGGDTIMTDGTYWYHAFKSSGTFTPAKGLSCDVLVVAGGGGGGGYGGGGGAGGVAYQTSRSATTTGYTVTIGAGGAAGAGQFNNGATGSNSVFDTITANGGGGGGSIGNNGSGGGSGGGGANATSGGASTQGSSGGATGYGFAGGTGLNGPTLGGGGGGAGAVGANAGGGVAGNGGAGLNTWSSWLSTTGLGVSGYIAGGGGGGNDNNATGSSGGAGGGGAGGRHNTSAGGAGVANTGGGGGGENANYYTSASGGSGLVIIRYAV